MAVIKHIEDSIYQSAYQFGYPKQMVSDKEKKSDSWIKNNLDFFEWEALKQYDHNKNTFARNYNLVKGILTPEDFYEEPEVRNMIDTLMKNENLPAYVKHYPILNPPINSIVGEMSKRPDNARVKAVDSDSQAQELQFKTDILLEYGFQVMRNTVMAQMARKGADFGDPQVQQQVEEITATKVQEQISNYTSTAEKWANKVLESCKLEFNMKELSEEAMRDLVIGAREFFHVFEDNSKLGFGVENVNPKEVWGMRTPGKKYSRDWFAGGIISQMELSEILHRFKLDEDEIDNLTELVKEQHLLSPHESNLFRNRSGLYSIDYNTYDPTLVREREFAEAGLGMDGQGDVDSFLGLNSRVSGFGYKFTVLQSYWISKKKVGKLTYVDEEGNILSLPIDENYKKIPNEISIEWEWINQWYKGIKIGPEIYKVEPFDLLSYCPIIGVVHEIRNVDEAKSLVDLMKPFQVLYNICMNQLYRLLEKEIGNVFISSIRHIPNAKDGDDQDSLSIWEEEARERGIIFLDDSPENLKAPSAFNQFRNVDLTRSGEIQSRYNLAAQLKLECWELVGFSQQRLARVQATETATATNAALEQSYTQTEPYFVQHEYVINQVYQAIVDAAQYVQSQNPTSTLSYITNEGENAFVNVNGTEISLRDFKVFVTSRIEDQRFFNEVRQLAQPMLQNGASPYDIAIMFGTNSVRQMKEILKSVKDKTEQLAQQDLQIRQQELLQSQKQFELQQQLQINLEQQKLSAESFNAQLDRLSREKVAMIAASSKPGTPTTGSTPSADITSLLSQETAATNSYNLQMTKLQKDQEKIQNQLAIELQKLEIAKEKLQVDREKIAAQERIAKENKTKAELSSKRK